MKRLEKSLAILMVITALVATITYTIYSQALLAAIFSALTTLAAINAMTLGDDK